MNVSGVIIQKNITNVKPFWASFTKKDKILKIRQKHSEVRHEYYAMANKYKSWDKYMLSFTMPSQISYIKGRKDSNVKNRRYSKLRYLLELKAYIAKQFNNSKLDIKYFMNIELGKQYSNPHLHIQAWVNSKEAKERSEKASKHLANAQDIGFLDFKGSERKKRERTSKRVGPVDQEWTTDYKSNQDQQKSWTSGPHQKTSSKDLIKRIYDKAIAKFELVDERCDFSISDKDEFVYHYVAKDYAKDLSDEDAWNLEVQKKRMRDQIGKKTRFYSKSQDKHSKKWYRFVYKYYNKVREFANEFIDKLKELFSKFFFKNIIIRENICLCFSELFLYNNKIDDYVFSFVFYVLYSARDPPFLLESVL